MKNVCLGRETQYYRRIQDRDCFIGEKLVQPREVTRNCSCTEEDFECDFNFVRDANNKVCFGRRTFTFDTRV